MIAPTRKAKSDADVLLAGKDECVLLVDMPKPRSHEEKEDKEEKDDKEDKNVEGANKTKVNAGMVGYSTNSFAPLTVILLFVVSYKLP